MATLIGSDGDDLLVGGAENDDLYGKAGNDILEGQAGNDSLYGGAGLDSLFGGAGADYLDGGTGADTMAGGSGDDTSVVDTALDAVLENPGEGVDTVISAVNYELPANVENLYLASGSAAVSGTGNAEDNELVGNEADNTLDGVAGADFLYGKAGSDLLYGGAGDDYLDGGTGADIMTGGIGHDNYLVDTAGDEVLEDPGEGIDTVISAVNYTLFANVENLYLASGSAAVSGTGNAGDNELVGNQADNILDGQDGRDTLYGMAGNDLLLGGALKDYLTGGTGNDTLMGGSGDDHYRFAIGDGVDTITDLAVLGEASVWSPLSNAVQFGAGITLDDFTLGFGGGALQLHVGTNGDQINLMGFDPNDAYGAHAVEAFGFADGTWLTYQQLIDWGIDVTGTAGADTLTGTNASDLILGLAGDDLIQAGAAADQLQGGTGNDTLIGGAGNDAYRFVNGDGVDTITDVAAPGEGNAVEFGLGVTLADLTIGFSGGALQLHVGTTGDQINLTGFDPNDAYGAHAVDAFQFWDDNHQIMSQFSYQDMIDWGFDVVGTAGADTLTGTNASDLILGLAGDDLIQAGAADDQLVGGTGHDTLVGGADSDDYRVSLGDGQDTVVDTAGTGDSLSYGATINPLDLVLSRQANDLRVAIHGSADQVTVQDWYLGASHQIETIQAGNGQTLLSTQVDQLTQAMASFSQQTGLTWDQAIDQRPQEVQTVLAASWQ